MAAHWQCQYWPLAGPAVHSQLGCPLAVPELAISRPCRSLPVWLPTGSARNGHYPALPFIAILAFRIAHWHGDISSYNIRDAIIFYGFIDCETAWQNVAWLHNATCNDLDTHQKEVYLN